jgi:hypothetical protein
VKLFFEEINEDKKSDSNSQLHFQSVGEFTNEMKGFLLLTTNKSKQREELRLYDSTVHWLLREISFF